MANRNLSCTLWLLMIAALLATLALALWLSLRHQTPNITIVDFTIPTSNNNDTNNVDNSHHCPHFTLTLLIKNPSNTYTIVYNTIMVTVHYNQSSLGKMNIPGFEQGKGKELGESCHIEANEQVLETLSKALSSPSSAPAIMVELNTGIQYKNLGHKSRQRDLRFQGQFNIGSDGKILKKKVKLHKGN